jgi:glutathione S-transferase
MLNNNYQEIQPKFTTHDTNTMTALQISLAYLRDRIGVPRDMSYPAARQFRAHLNWMISQLN